MTNLRRKNNHDPQQKRLKFLSVFIFLFGFALVYRLADLQIFSSASIQASAARQHSTERVLPAERGEIFYTDAKSDTLYPLATNRAFNHLYIVPRDVENIEYTFNMLWPLFKDKGLTEDVLRARISKTNDIYEPLARKLTDEELAPFAETNLPGLGWEDEMWRYYPEAETLSHVIGFVGLQDDARVGQYGLEDFFEEELKGKEGLLVGQVDTSGRLIKSGDNKVIEGEKGVDIVLTIDRTIQAYACQRLKEKVKDTGAEGGNVVVLNPATGAIMVMCSEPGFDPNNYNEVEDIFVYLNPVIASTYEPGSIFKSITMAAGIDQDAVSPETTYIDEGVEEIGKYKIRNSDGKAHGEVDMVTVLDESLNTGAIFVERQLGNEMFYKYVQKFGFGKPTGIELGGELAGDISSLAKAGDIYAATGSFGQGITVTPIQIAQAYAAIANGGKLVKPYLIKEKRKNNKIIYHGATEVMEKELLSLRASTIISGMLVSVVRAGHAKSAGVGGYYIAGKTGTAQVAGNGGYGSDTIHSFVGYGPVDNPIFVMLTKLDKPKYAQFAASTAAPLFGDIAKFILQYYEVPPDENI